MASKSPASALLFATLPLFAAASALGQEHGCPAATDLDPMIVTGVLGRPQMLSDSLQKTIDELTTTELGKCICKRIIPATGITSGGTTGQVLTSLTKGVLKSLGRNIPAPATGITSGGTSSLDSSLTDVLSDLICAIRISDIPNGFEYNP